MTRDSSAGASPGRVLGRHRRGPPTAPLCKLRDRFTVTRVLCSGLVSCAAPTVQGSPVPGSQSTLHARVAGRDGLVAAPGHADGCCPADELTAIPGGTLHPRRRASSSDPSSPAHGPSPQLSVRKEETPMPSVLLPPSR